MANIRNRIQIPLEIVKEEKTICEFVTFDEISDAGEHFAIIFGSAATEQPLVRVHSECITGDLFGSLKCDCGPQLKDSLLLFKQNGGVLVYLRQEGRGIGLTKKLDAYTLQQNGHDTFEANLMLGYPEDKRNFGIAAEMLHALGLNNIKLITNNPEKITTLRNHNISVIEQIVRPTFMGDDNKGYLFAKKSKANHKLSVI